jgi:hypothetical protein
VSRVLIDFITKYQILILSVALALMTYATAVRMVPEFEQLIWGADRNSAAVDLRMFHRNINLWFSGDPTFGKEFLVYPPASLMMLWPLVGWLDLEMTRWLWAISTVGALAVLIVVLGREVGAARPFHWAFVALLVLSAKATGQTIGNGQITLHVLAALVLGVLLLCRDSRGVGWDLSGAALVLFSLVKLNVAAPFFWLPLFARRRCWPAVVVIVGYVALTVIALSFGNHQAMEVATTWAASSAKTASKYGQGNLSMWLSVVGLGRYVPVAIVVSLGALGAWLFRYRNADLWLRIGVTAIFTRLWTYHYFYDDVLLLLAMIALLRVATDERWSDAHRALAGIVMLLLMCNSVALNPLQALMPLANVFRIGALVCLVYLTHKSLLLGDGWRTARGWGRVRDPRAGNPESGVGDEAVMLGD